jgi:hypothetical protein
MGTPACTNDFKAFSRLAASARLAPALWGRQAMHQQFFGPPRLLNNSAKSGQ